MVGEKTRGECVAVFLATARNFLFSLAGKTSRLMKKLSEGLQGQIRFKPKRNSKSVNFEMQNSSFDVDEVMRRIWARYDKRAESE